MNATAHIDVARSTLGYRAHIRIVTPNGSGSREIEDARCELLADEAVLVLALSAGETHVRVAHVRWMVAVLGGALLGPLPSLAPNATVSFALEWSALRVELYANYALPQRKRLGDDVFEGRFYLFGGGLRSGLAIAFHRFELVPSLGIAAYHFIATGEGGSWSRTGVTRSWGPALGLLTRLRVSDHWAIAATGESVLLLLRPHFVFLDAGSLHQPSGLALQLCLGVEFRL